MASSFLSSHAFPVSDRLTRSPSRNGRFAPVLVGGSTAVVAAAERHPQQAITQSGSSAALGRFSEAISEGDGISVIPILSGDIAALAALAEEARAEALAVRATDDVARARSSTGLPIISREFIRAGADLRTVESAQADACCLVVGEVENGGLLEDLYAQAATLGVECALDVRDEEELEAALERVDPEILIFSERDAASEEESLERTLELLADVPAGKLVISESRISSRAQVLALEESGVDALILSNTPESARFSAVIAELSGPAPPTA